MGKASKRYINPIRWLRIYAIAAGVLVTLLGLIVMGGWYTHQVTIIQIIPHTPAMRCNTALAFVLCGLALVTLGLRQYGKVRWLSMAVVVIGLATLIEYLFDLNLGIDQLLIEDYVTNTVYSPRQQLKLDLTTKPEQLLFTINQSFPGRPCPLTALGFTLTGSALGLLSRKKRRWQTSLSAGLLAVVVVGLSVTALIGYLGGVVTAYTWSPLLGIAVHTALGLLLLGTGGVALALADRRRKNSRLPRWLPLIIGFGILSTNLFLWRAATAYEESQMQSQIQAEIVALEQQIKVETEAHLQLLRTLGKQQLIQAKLPKNLQEKSAKLLVNEDKSTAAIAYFNPKQQVSSIEGSEDATALVLSAWKHSILVSARNRREVMFTSVNPIDRKVFLVYIPLFTRDTFAGWNVDSILLEEWFNDIVPAIVITPGFKFSIFDGKTEIYTRVDGISQDFDPDWSQEIPINYPGVTWKGKLWPSSQWLASQQSPTIKATMLITDLLAILVLLFVYSAQVTFRSALKVERSNQQLHREVQKRTSAELALQQANKTLEIQIQERTQELLQAKETLERRVAERTSELAAVNLELKTFSYSVSHDLRAPLRVIDGFGEALLEHCGEALDDKGKHYLQRIRASNQRMEELIHDLLMLSRVTQGEMRRTTVNLSAIAQEIALNLQETQPERHVTWAIASGIFANGDSRLLRGVLENLLNNAWKFTSNTTHPLIEFNVTVSKNGTTYFIRDNGAGFDMTYVNKLFGAFQRLHTTAEFPGTGIGLATVQRVIHRHGGQVWAEGAVGVGATFYFTLL